jgi:hypothetical protein
LLFNWLEYSHVLGFEKRKYITVIRGKNGNCAESIFGGV